LSNRIKENITPIATVVYEPGGIDSNSISTRVNDDPALPGEGPHCDDASVTDPPVRTAKAAHTAPQPAANRNLPDSPSTAKPPLPP
jgi:hypothetical protein